MQEIQKVVVENAASINAGQDRTTKTAITMNTEIQKCNHRTYNKV